MIRQSAFRLSPADRPGSCRRTRCPTASYTTPGDTIPGPVLANYGLDTLRFVKPLQPGETIKVRLTAKDKSPRNKQYGEVRWDVEIMTDKGETAATYELLTMNAVRA
jgi:acyl dehydratase